MLYEVITAKGLQSHVLKSCVQPSYPIVNVPLDGTDAAGQYTTGQTGGTPNVEELTTIEVTEVPVAAFIAAGLKVHVIFDPASASKFRNSIALHPFG